MRQPRRVAGLEGWDCLPIEPALPFRRLHHFSKSCLAQDFVEVAQVKRRPVLSVAEDEIGKASSQGIEMAGEIVVEPVVTILLEGENGVRQAGHDDSHPGSGLEYASALEQQLLQFIGIKM